MSQENQSESKEQTGSASREPSKAGTTRRGAPGSRAPIPFPQSQTAVSQADGEA